MEEAEGILGLVIESIPVSAGCLQKGEGADDVCLDEFGGPMDGTINM